MGEKKKYQKNVERNVLNVIDYLYNYTKIKNIQIFYPILLTCKKLHGIFYFGKNENYFKGKPVERQGAQSQKGLKSESLTMSAGCHCFHINIIYGKDV